MRIAINVCHDYRRTRWFRHVDRARALEDLPDRYLRVDPQEDSLLMDVLRCPSSCCR